MKKLKKLSQVHIRSDYNFRRFYSIESNYVSVLNDTKVEKIEIDLNNVRKSMHSYLINLLKTDIDINKIKITYADVDDEETFFVHMQQNYNLTFFSALCFVLNDAQKKESTDISKKNIAILDAIQNFADIELDMITSIKLTDTLYDNYLKLQDNLERVLCDISRDEIDVENFIDFEDNEQINKYYLDIKNKFTDLKLNNKDIDNLMITILVNDSCQIIIDYCVSQINFFSTIKDSILK